MSTEQEIQVYRKYFLAQDKDGTGSLNRTEFKSMLKSMGLQFTDREITKAFNNCDKNRGGSITFNEFSKAFLKKDRRHQVAPERVKEVYERVDKDGDGALTKAECVEAMKMLGKNLDDAGIERIMQIMDKDSDDGISFYEFNRFFEI